MVQQSTVRYSTAETHYKVQYTVNDRCGTRDKAGTDCGFNSQPRSRALCREIQSLAVCSRCDCQRIAWLLFSAVLSLNSRRYRLMSAVIRVVTTNSPSMTGDPFSPWALGPSRIRDPCQFPPFLLVAWAVTVAAKAEDEAAQFFVCRYAFRPGRKKKPCTANSVDDFYRSLLSFVSYLSYCSSSLSSVITRTKAKGWSSPPPALGWDVAQEL